ncbi:hypothetical protein SPRG_11064 [Saprolegnia parasitica CBS 223.65]|uniref:Uncharacterized bromodomain-containing protein 10 helical domain-containing protein n=1 Tax=Saprolegnia parasitica (strain CBS 223.65) TaxID=695850 RepID=A0A067C9Y4_SAPPC|nr:hypothetical protein SPRG_11064 [Saprolegnia parasitica CBS 223.65]KDO23617.1 hypothetical protein SPRG_11064 [Saprolegnia parasitica CBS 223.65]|eukprot:XP_012205601.1 hypothetical protein SPRG_11064 [Saprolegnia parasitica CBS 223.65]
MVWEKRKRVKPTIFQVEDYEPKKRQTKPVAKKPAPAKAKATSKAKKQEDDAEVKPAKKAKTSAKKEPTPRKGLDITEFKKLLGSPFYLEDGAEWHGTDIDFDELATLRSMWQLPAACHILWLLQRPLNLKIYGTLREYEAALLNPETSVVLEEVFTKLLLAKKERDRLAQGAGLTYDWWNKRLKEHYAGRYQKLASLKRRANATSGSDESVDDEDDNDDDENNSNTGDESADETPKPSCRLKDLSDDEWALLDRLGASLALLGDKNPLETHDFKALDPRTRCLVLLDLCESTVSHPSNLEYIREMEDDDLRVQPIGTDRVGNRYFYYAQFYHERRVYRLSPDADASWELWAKGLDSVTALHDALLLATKRGRHVAGETELIDHMEAMLEMMHNDAADMKREEEKALKRAILEAMPRKRSARIQVLTMEKFEEEQQEREARLAKEAAEEERRRHKADAAAAKEMERKRLLTEMDQRQALNTDRLTRRQRKLVEEKA